MSVTHCKTQRQTALASMHNLSIYVICDIKLEIARVPGRSTGVLGDLCPAAHHCKNGKGAKANACRIDDLDCKQRLPTPSF
jgi:hypothetical protein